MFYKIVIDPDRKTKIIDARIECYLDNYGSMFSRKIQSDSIEGLSELISASVKELIGGNAYEY